MMLVQPTATIYNFQDAIKTLWQGLSPPITRKNPLRCVVAYPGVEQIATGGGSFTQGIIQNKV